MKKWSFVSAVLVLLGLGLAPRSIGADLQAGWYVNLYGLEVDSPGPDGPRLRAIGGFWTQPGMYGPFSVTADPPPYQVTTRRVTVPVDALGVGPEASLVLPIDFGLSLGERIAFILISWETDYDATQMRLELWRTRGGGGQELVWYQPLSGHRTGFPSVMVAEDSIYEGPYYYRLSVIPEPSGIVALLGGLAVVGGTLWRRRLG